VLLFAGMDRSPQRSPQDAFPRFLWVLGVAACGLYLVAEAVVLAGDFGFPLDDSWIHLQFARNLAGGEGMSYNAGDLVTGSTAPLWTALLALPFLLPGSVVLWVKALGILCYLASIHATFRLACELKVTRPLAILASFLTLATGRLVWSALSGMEVNLFLLLSLWGMILHLRERRSPDRPPISLAVLGVAVLARPEGALLLVLAVGDRLLGLLTPAAAPSPGSNPTVPLRQRAIRLAARLAPGLACAALVLAAPLLFYRGVGGSWLPTTFSIKGSGVVRWLPEVLYLREIWGIFFITQPWLTLAAPAGVLVLLERLGGPRDRGLLPALWVLGLPLTYSLMSPLGAALIAGNFGRYYFPLIPVVVVLGVLGIERIIGLLARSRLRLPLGGGQVRQVPVVALLAVLLVWPTVALGLRQAAGYAKNVTDVQDSNVRFARFLAERLPPEAVLAVNDIGAFKYFLPNRILDVVGIASPEAKRHRVRRMAEGATFYQAVVEYLERHRPDYLAIFPEWLSAITQDPRFEPLYVLPIPDNRTMGGDEIVLFKTPWTRYSLAEAERRPGDPVPILSAPVGAPDVPDPEASDPEAPDAGTDPATRPLPR